MRRGALALALAMEMGLAGLTPASATAQEGARPPAPGASWQLPDEALGARIAPILLLSRPDVRAELAADPELAEAASLAIDDLHARAAALRGRSGAEAVAARREVDELASRWIDEHLTAEQRTRLEQLDLQWEGASAMLSRPTIAASLGLSDDQRRQLSGALRPAVAPGEDPLAAHRRRHRNAAALLSEDQRLRWLAMLGPPFEPDAVRTALPASPGG